MTENELQAIRAGGLSITVSVQTSKGRWEVKRIVSAKEIPDMPKYASLSWYVEEMAAGTNLQEIAELWE